MNGAPADESERALIAELEARALTCLEDAPLAAGARLYLVASGTGQLNLSVEPRGGEAFLRCLERAMRGRVLRPAHSRFLTVHWEISR
jgi:hypothetical protein